MQIAHMKFGASSVSLSVENETYTVSLMLDEETLKIGAYADKISAVKQFMRLICDELACLADSHDEAVEMESILP